MKNIVQAHEIFVALDQELHAKQWITKDPLMSRQIRLSNEIQIVLAVRKNDGRHILYIQCNPNDVDKRHKYPAWRGINIDFSAFDNAGITGCYVRIEQGDGSDDEVYFAVADDLCACLEGVKKSDLRKKLSNALERWKRFFSLRDNVKLTKEEQLGLYGELWLLHNLIKQNQCNQIVDFWKGPYHEVFDFSMPNLSIEAKATSSKMPYKIHISNEIQLNDKLAGGTLILFFIALQPNDSSGETLKDVVTSINDLIKNDIVINNLFHDKIFTCGLSGTLIDSYSTRYLVKEYGYFNVKNDFPRILSQNLHNGLGDISYTLEISACSQYKINEQEFLEILESHAKGECM